MKTLKIMPLVMGVLVAAAITVSPLAAMAETQQPSSRGEITLSQEQQAKFQDIRKRTISEIAQVLTPEQMEAFKKDGPQGLTNLSGTQKTQLQKIFQSYLKSIEGILTKEQLQQMQQAQPKQ
jgi:Spy/CpxP family protein refolding chaperone